LRFYVYKSLLNKNDEYPFTRLSTELVKVNSGSEQLSPLTETNRTLFEWSNCQSL